jgi:predicted nucleotidyltransferase
VRSVRGEKRKIPLVPPLIKGENKKGGFERKTMLNEIEKKAIGELIEKLKETYGENLVKVILYGSKARGDQTEDSDIDIMIILQDFKNKVEEIKKVSAIVSSINFIYEVFISPVILRKNDYETGNLLLVRNVIKEGFDLWMK